MAEVVFSCDIDTVPGPPLGLRFELSAGGELKPAFLVKIGAEGELRAYYNQCAHMQLELDWSPGLFFDNENRYLMCATHGALFDPDTGWCLSGPCAGDALVALPVTVRAGRVLVGPAF